MKQYTTLIFDFDGTLADTSNIIWDAYEHIFSKYNLKKVKRSEVVDLKEMSARDFMKEMKISPLKIPWIVADINQHIQKNVWRINPTFVQWEAILRVLKYKQKKALGIVSSNTIFTINAFLENHHLNIFDFIRTGSLFRKHFTIKRLAKKGYVDLGDTLYIGDEVRDIQMARNAGIHIASVAWGFNSKETLLGYAPDYLLEHPEELIHLAK